MSDPLEALYTSVPTPEAFSNRPSVTLSYAQSLDGSIAATAGQGLLLSGEHSMAMTHQLRASHDGILVGIETVLADNPRLTTRLVEGAHPRPIVLDSQLRTPLEANILKHPQPVWIAHAESARKDRISALLEAGAQLIPLPQTADGGLDLAALLAALKSRGVVSLMVEGGARVITSFLTQELVDVLVLTISPRLVGGLRAPTVLLAAQLRIRTPSWLTLGEDQIVWGSPEWERP
jgi:3,4-dihydroxy 2-butanone 4-phosphate synthase/GTP cyclohydrolase II